MQSLAKSDKCHHVEKYCARNSRKFSTPRATEDNPDEFVLEIFTRRLNHEMLTMPVYFKDNFNHTIQFHKLYQQHSEKLFFDRYRYLMIGWLDSSVGRTLQLLLIWSVLLTKQMGSVTRISVAFSRRLSKFACKIKWWSYLLHQAVNVYFWYMTFRPVDISLRSRLAFSVYLS